MTHTNACRIDKHWILCQWNSTVLFTHTNACRIEKNWILCAWNSTGLMTHSDECSGRNSVTDPKILRPLLLIC